MPANSRWDLIRRLKFNTELGTEHLKTGNDFGSFFRTIHLDYLGDLLL